jgi:hypothetical protein
LKSVSISLRLTLWFSGIFLAGFVIFGIARAKGDAVR